MHADIDDFSRKIIFLVVRGNNGASLLESFKQAVSTHQDGAPSRVR